MPRPPLPDLFAASDLILPQFFIDSESDFLKSGSGGKVVTMMQTAEPWHCYAQAAAARLVRGFRSNSSAVLHRLRERFSQERLRRQGRNDDADRRALALLCPGRRCQTCSRLPI